MTFPERLGPPPVPTTLPVPAGPNSATTPPFEQLLGHLGAELDRGERLVHRAAAGVRVDDAAALIAIQAGIYRYTETVDLTAKLVDAGSHALRTMLQSGA